MRKNILLIVTILISFVPGVASAEGESKIDQIGKIKLPHGHYVVFCIDGYKVFQGTSTIQLKEMKDGKEALATCRNTEKKK